MTHFFHNCFAFPLEELAHDGHFTLWAWQSFESINKSKIILSMDIHEIANDGTQICTGFSKYSPLSVTMNIQPLTLFSKLLLLPAQQRPPRTMYHFHIPCFCLHLSHPRCALPQRYASQAFSSPDSILRVNWPSLTMYVSRFSWKHIVFLVK